ncbi:leader peptidase (prepilin peptidase) / N-methyltransferase [Fervidobacterium changbaicum]|uniref:Prepilin peptidase n=2 Tax=Fervidobacterium changbaicum TaxID=310769 RepID=A0AAE5XAF6_9BACT|nr:A24 family peptidase [Fervidobacterium islandicum]QAV32970.1 prepilin peptidase [Fervidobacterium changbaicum]SDH60696.1 leader peptidase (prepilin peptidase) / N-methyltransferase [Fervidobacterium changbaicum]
MWNKVSLLFWFALGTIFGSFANVLIYRPIAGLKLTEPRFSVCPHCRRRIAWYDNIPIISFILLRGKCRHCGGKISLRYPLVELSFGLSFLVNHLLFPTDIALAMDAIFVASVPALFTDFKLMLLPDYTWITVLISSFLINLFHFKALILLDALGALISLGILFVLKLRYKDGIGEGDLFLLPVYAFAVGITFMPFLLLGSSLGGIVYSLLRKDRLIPFGPFIIFFGYLLLFLRVFLYV